MEQDLQLERVIPANIPNYLLYCRRFAAFFMRSRDKAIWRTPMRSPGKCERKAVATVELAVLLPVLTFLFVIIVDYGRVFYFSQVIENCARQGALYASDSKAPEHNLYSSVQDAALADATGLTPQPTVTSTSGTDKAGHAYVQVTVTWAFQTVTHFAGVPDVTLSRTIQMRAAP